MDPVLAATITLFLVDIFFLFVYRLMISAFFHFLRSTAFRIVFIFVLIFGITFWNYHQEDDPVEGSS